MSDILSYLDSQIVRMVLATLRSTCLKVQNMDHPSPENPDKNHLLASLICKRQNETPDANILRFAFDVAPGGGKESVRKEDVGDVQELRTRDRQRLSRW